jgi:hypothetical protein
MRARFWTMVSILTVAVGALSPTAVGAQESSAPPPVYEARSPFNYGVGLAINYPFDSFGDEVDTGYGLHGMLDYTFIPLLHFIADLGWNHFSGNEFRESVDILEITFGAKFQFGAFFMGGETGYYSQVDEWSFVPSLGARFTRLEIALRIKAVGGGSWTGLRIGYYF